MTVATDAEGVREGDSVVTEADEPLVISEAAAIVAEGAVQTDGSVLMHLIRPCVGRGRGRHLYEADMLRQNASKMQGWKMFKNHEPPEERRKRGGLPRPVQDVGGIVLESWWEDEVPAGGRFGKGAVMGRVMPTEDVQALIKVHPKLVEASINTHATGVQQVRRDGQVVNLVEGIADDGSVDWVTEGGAGGRIVQAIMEALDDDSEPELSEMNDDQLVEYLGRRRPQLLLAITEAVKADPPDDAEPDGDADDAEYAKRVKKYKDKGLPQKLAERAAKREAAKTQEGREEDDVAELTDEQIEEALSSDAGQEAIARSVATHAHPIVRRLVESTLESEREKIQTEAERRANRKWELRDLRDHAKSRITEAHLPDGFEQSILKRFSLVEGAPTTELDVKDEVDEESGDVKKTAKKKIDDAVDDAIKEARALIRSANPTFVSGQGGGTPEGDADADGKIPLPNLVEAGIKQMGFPKDMQLWPV